jgi:predicted O-linked N-acetylglucosamine transferase (SPINDLY family)
VFAKRLAPVQITFIGWPTTTGIAAMDYNIVDAITDLPGAEKFYTEKLIRMSKTSLCHVLVPTVPPVPEPPVKKNGYITFGVFCSNQKLSPETIKLLARTTKAVKHSKLLIRGYYPDDLLEDMRARFLAAGLPKNRLELENRLSTMEYPKGYHDVDIILDTIPFNGATTTCDALNMGVAVVTVEGDRQQSRRGMSILRNAGLDDLIASNQEKYIKIACELAADIDRLQYYRTNLRRIKTESNLADSKAFVQEYAYHVRKTWIDCCREHNITAADYSQKTDLELIDEMKNAKQYLKYDSSGDVQEQYNRLQAEYTRRGLQ